MNVHHQLCNCGCYSNVNANEVQLHVARTAVRLCLNVAVSMTSQVRSLRADVVALEIASGDGKRKVHAAESAAAAAQQQLQEAEEQVHALDFAMQCCHDPGMQPVMDTIMTACVTLGRGACWR